jgi:hypothetical protein
MGRAGIEPATLGLKVNAEGSRALEGAGKAPLLSRIESGGLGSVPTRLLTLR